MPKITQHIFNRKRLGSILNNISLEFLANHTTVSDIKEKIQVYRIYFTDITHNPVIPAEAGIQIILRTSGFPPSRE